MATKRHADRRLPPFVPAARWSALVALAVGLVLALVAGPPVAEASERGNRVEFTVTVESPDGIDDDDLRARTRRNVAKEVRDRIAKRLDAIEIKHYELEVTEGYGVLVTVYGDHSPEAIRGAVIPSGRFELRPVLVDASPWLEVAPELPEGVEFYHEPGSLETNNFFLFSPSPAPLHRAIGLLGGDSEIYVFPHDDGWRTLNLGPALATGDDVGDVEIERGPTGMPYVTVSLSSGAAQRMRGEVRGGGVRHLAVVLDGEVVAVESFSSRSRAEVLQLDPPDHLRSMSARGDWAVQVAGRMAATIPVQLGEYEE